MRVAVIGAGVFGAWTAKCLAEAGHGVTLIDAYGPANGRASSADHSRVIRAGYGADAIYSRWATESLGAWQTLATSTGLTLLTRTGALFMGEAGNAYVRATYETLRSLNLPVDWLTPERMHLHYPQIATDRLDGCVLELHGGVIRARMAVQAVMRTALATGRVKYIIGLCEEVDETRTAIRVRLAAGGAIEADAFVFACGAWLPRIFPDAIGGRIRPTRQEVLYFGVPPGNGQLSVAQLPVWIDFGAGFYGIPDLDACGFKVGVDRHGGAFDPDGGDRVVDASLVSATRNWMGERFPAMRNAPLLDAHVCQYENTSSGDFIIDRHPQWDNCWIVGGGSGHGFKHGPAVGKYLTGLITGAVTPEARFALGTKDSAARRQVY